MTAIEVKEKALIDEINKDARLLDSALNYIRRMKKKTEAISPCQFTPDQLKIEVRRSVADAKKGNGKSLDQIRAKHPRI